MADVTDPNAAPMRHDVRPDFPAWQTTLAAFLGIAATVVGIVLGLVLVND
jgi:hypothetical protein